MIREATVNLTRRLYRPLNRAGLHGVRKPAGGLRRMTRQPARYPVLDNARFLLISLVVTGHLLEQLADQGPMAAALYRWIYLFHMPAFVLISGALSKSALTQRRLIGLFTGLLLPYLVFQTLYPAWDAWLFGTGDWSQGYLTPYWLLWYLPSLACWRLLLPAFARLRRPVLAASLIALAAGCMPDIGYPFSLSRTLVFLPLFMLGYRIGPQALKNLGTARTRRGAAALVLVAAAVVMWWLRDLDPEWLYGVIGYADLQATPLAGAVMRLALLVAAAVCALACITLVPRWPRWAALGQRSLTSYLVHGFLVRAAVAAGFFAWLAEAMPEPASMALCAALGFAVAAMLSTRWADTLASPLVHPVRWITHLRGL